MENYFRKHLLDNSRSIWNSCNLILYKLCAYSDSDGNFYSSMAAEAEESDVSDADVGALAKSLSVGVLFRFIESGLSWDGEKTGN